MQATQPHPARACELTSWAVAETLRQRRAGAETAALCCGVDAGSHALQLAEAGARVTLLGEATPAPTHPRIVTHEGSCLRVDDEALQPAVFDLILCQRCLNTLRYDDARRAVRRLFERLKIGGKLFISLYGIHSELGDHYPDGGKLVNDRLADVPPALAQRYGLSGPVCLYSERNLFSLLLEAGGAVLKTSTSALGHVRGIAARI